LQFRFTETESFIDTTSCSFPIALSFQTTVVGRVYFDNSGNFLGLTFHQDAIGTDSANGITLKESDHLTDMFNADGSAKEVGLPIHIQGANGLVIRDAGYLLINPDGSVAVIHGPHPQLEGNTAPLCDALS
jgi:hypothetical protein